MQYYYVMPATGNMQYNFQKVNMEVLFLGLFCCSSTFLNCFFQNMSSFYIVHMDNDQSQPQCVLVISVITEWIWYLIVETIQM